MNDLFLYEGKAKILYRTTDPTVLRVVYKDDATAFNAQKRSTIAGKGELNCAIATYILQYLDTQGIPTHFLSQSSSREMLVQAVTIVPLEVVVRNLAAGSLCQRTGIPLGTELARPLVEFFYKNDVLGDPLFTEDHIDLLHLATPEQVQSLKRLAIDINHHLQTLFAPCRLTLVDFKLEFGLNASGQLLLADEVSPDTCRLWDQVTADPQERILDKDRFRHDLGKVADAYAEVLKRLQESGKVKGL
ncbi:MAG: phosphoribosylaminoimidazolesuccinocarboxamide synthase [Oscillatoriales cyanobacterium SM2_2_1]|nr:phosphoribosylaminoimidazolesuccinocarboxamide synthase [Oscillatoriales cyanobacterium SM2_2_1]